jgi:hypothetical protein
MQKLNNWVTQSIDQVDLAKKTCTVCLVFFLPQLYNLSIQNRSWNYVEKKKKGNDKKFCDN